MNKIILLGRLGQEPELKYAKSGTAILTVSLATSDAYKENDEWKERTEWHSIVMFGRRAETIAEYCSKGDQLLVEGKLQTQKWQDKDGNDRYKTEVISQQVEFFGKRKKQQQESSQSEQSSQTGEEEGEFEFDEPAEDF